MKRILSTILVVLIVLGTFPALASAEGKTSGLFTYELKGNGTAIITAFDWDSFDGGDVYIPRMIDGYTVTEIGANAFACDSYVNRQADGISLILPDTITVIGEKAFAAESPDLGKDQYDEGIYFQYIHIPASVQFIGDGAFVGQGEVFIDSGNPIYTTIDNAVYNKKTKELIYISEFESSSSEKELIIPEGIVSVGAYACYGRRMHTVQFPSTLNSIGDYAFYDTFIFSSIDFPTSLTSIGDYAFARAHVWVRFSKGSDGFNRTGLYLPENVTHIGKGVFQYAGLGYGHRPYAIIHLGDCKITEIPDFAFSGLITATAPNESTTINWPEGLTRIGEMAFSDVHIRLSELPVGIKQIGAGAFQNATFRSLKNGIFTLPEGLEEIGERAFSDSQKLEELILPSTLTHIGSNICNRAKVKLQVQSGTYAALWASENGYMTTSADSDDLSWLND